MAGVFNNGNSDDEGNDIKKFTEDQQKILSLKGKKTEPYIEHFITYSIDLNFLNELIKKVTKKDQSAAAMITNNKSFIDKFQINYDNIVRYIELNKNNKISDICKTIAEKQILSNKKLLFRDKYIEQVGKSERSIEETIDVVIKAIATKNIEFMKIVFEYINANMAGEDEKQIMNAFKEAGFTKAQAKQFLDNKYD
jgi:hypothetical protein